MNVKHLSSLEVSLTELSVPYEGRQPQCFLVVGGRSATFNYPSAPVLLQDLDLSRDETLFVSISLEAQELGTLKLPLTPLLQAGGGPFDTVCELFPPERGHSYSFGETPPSLRLLMTTPEAACSRCSLLEELAADLSTRLGEVKEQLSCSEEARKELEGALKDNGKERADLLVAHDNQKTLIRELNSNVQELNSQVASLSEVAGLYEHYKTQLAAAVKHSEDLTQAYHRSMSDYEQQKKLILSASKGKTEEIANLYRKVSELTQQLDELAEGQAEQTVLSSKAALYDDQRLIEAALKSQVKTLELCVSSLQESAASSAAAFKQRIGEFNRGLIEAQPTALQSIEEKTTTHHLKSRRSLYRPVTNDPIDVALSDYVNTASSPEKITFSREKQGLYTFGTKRVFVKLEQGKVIVRVGGGFLKIEDFIDMYAPTELVRCQNRQRGHAVGSLHVKFTSALLTSSRGHQSPCFGSKQPPSPLRASSSFSTKKNPQKPSRATAS